MTTIGTPKLTTIPSSASVQASEPAVASADSLPMDASPALTTTPTREDRPVPSPPSPPVIAPITLPNHAIATTTYLLDVAVGGGTNHAALCTEAQLRVTDKRGSKKLAPKARPSQKKPAGGAEPSHAAGNATQSEVQVKKHKGIKRKRHEEFDQEQGSKPSPKMVIRIPARP